MKNTLKIYVWIFYPSLMIGLNSCNMVQTLPIQMGMVDKNDAVILAAISGKVTNMEILMEQGADVNTSTEYGYTALHIAAFQNDAQIVKLLLSDGAKIDVTSLYGDTPLSLALEQSHYEIACLLVQKHSQDSLEILSENDHKAPSQTSWEFPIKSFFQMTTPLYHNGRIKLGFGNPYGLFGLNMEVGTQKFSVSLGLGSVEQITTWSVGGRLYLVSKIPRIRPRVGAFYGVIDIYSPRNYDELSSRVPVMGYYMTAGLEYQMGNIFWDIDIVFPIELRKYRDYEGFLVLPSFGGGIRF